MEQQSNAETQKVIQILYAYFLQQFQDEQKAAAGVQAVAAQLKDPGFKLVHFGETVFGIAVTDKNTVEFQARVGNAQNPTLEIHTAMKKLIKYLKKLDVKLIYMRSLPDQAQQAKKFLQPFKFKTKDMDLQGQQFVAFYKAL
jgi:hypothetical protein